MTRGQRVVDYAVAWQANLVYDTIIFILTVAKAWEGGWGICGARIGLVRLMFRDGRPYLYL